MASPGGSNFKSVLSGGMGSHLVISDHGQEAELLSRHLIYLCSHSMPRVCGVLLSMCLWTLTTKGTSGLQPSVLPQVPRQWTRIVPKLAPYHRLCDSVHREKGCRLSPRVERPCSGPKCSSQGIFWHHLGPHRAFIISVLRSQYSDYVLGTSAPSQQGM